MKQQFTIIFLSIVSCLAIFAAEKPSTVSGHVSSELAEVLGGATVLLSQPNDTVILTGIYTDARGNFTLPGDLPVRLNISLVGYLPVDTVVNTSPVSIILKESPHALDEVTVTASKLNMKAKPGGFVFDPSGIYKWSSNAADLLSYVPLIAKGNKTLSIITKETPGALILINGKEPSYPQNVILDKLSAMSPSDIKSIEIITNPGAKYDIDVYNSGVINIVLEDKYKGALGVINAGAGISEKQISSVFPSGTFFFQNHKFLLSASAEYNLYRSRQWNEYLTEDKTNGILRNSESKVNNRFQKVTGAITAEYNFTDVQSLTATFSTFSFEQKNTSHTSSSEVNSKNVLIYSESENLSKLPYNLSYQLGLRYINRFKSNGRSNLQVAFQYTHQSPNTNRNYFNSIYYIPNSPENSQSRNQTNCFSMEAYALQADYSYIFKDNSKVSFVGSFINQSNKTSYLDPTDRFKFEVTTNTQFLSIDYEKIFINQIGLRIGAKEYYSNRKINLYGENEKHNKDFIYLLPNASLSWMLGGGRHNFTLSWASFVRNPDDAMLNPYKVWVSSYEYETGNPDLSLDRTDELSFQYNFLGNLFFSANYRFGNDRYFSDYRYLDNDGNTVISYLNGIASKNLRLHLNYSRYFFDYRWGISSGVSVYYNSQKGIVSGVDYSVSDWYWTGNASTFVKISRRHNISANLAYSISGAQQTISVKNSLKQSLSASLSKGFGNTADIYASVYIPLNTFKTTYTSPGLTMTYNYHYVNCVNISLGATIRFGKKSIKMVKSAI